MIENKELENFLKNNRISDEDWQKSECEWTSLQAIAEHYEKSIDDLNRAAEWIAQKIQKIELVHSVRWRVKNAEHLLEKIIRKRVEKEEKYENISVENYQKIVTDLVGIRALHLFKEDCFEIDNELRKNSIQMVETPVAYLRNGDTLEEKFLQHGFDVKYKKSGYRSIHYLWLTPFADLTTIVEIQVRTIFEEGWSEIDHKVRYPNFSDDPLVVHFLNIFNQIAGNADEIGGFVQWLNSHIENSKIKFNQIAQESEEKENAICELDRIISSLKVESDEDKKTIGNLKAEITKLKNTSSPISIDLKISEASSKINDSDLLHPHKENRTKNVETGLLGNLNKVDFDEMSRTSIVNSAANAFNQYKNSDNGLLGLGRLNIDEISKTLIANSAANAFNQYKEELTKSSSGLLNHLGRPNFDEIYKTSSIANSATNALNQYKDELIKSPKDLLNHLGRPNFDEMYKSSTIADATKENILHSARGLNNLVLNPLDNIAKTQKLTGASIIDGLNNLNSCPKCFSKMSSSNKCPVCGF